MTREECIGLLKRYADYNGIGIPNLVGCKEAMKKAAMLLERTTPPLNLDDAAEEYSENILANNEDLQDAIEDAFKAGAGWMAEQGYTTEETVYFEPLCDECRIMVDFGWGGEPDRGGFDVGDRVIVQVRLKNKRNIKPKAI